MASFLYSSDVRLGGSDTELGGGAGVDAASELVWLMMEVTIGSFYYHNTNNMNCTSHFNSEV